MIGILVTVRLFQDCLCGVEVLRLIIMLIYDFKFVIFNFKVVISKFKALIFMLKVLIFKFKVVIFKFKVVIFKFKDLIYKLNLYLASQHSMSEFPVDNYKL